MKGVEGIGKIGSGGHGRVIRELGVNTFTIYYVHV